MRLTSTSLRAKSEDDEASVAPPPSVFIGMHHPRYLGPGPDASSCYFFSNNGDEVTDIVQLDAALALGEKDPTHPVHPDDVSISGSELSLARILDQSDDSITTASTAPDVSPFKRAGQDTIRESKRVKFESDL